MTTMTISRLPTVPAVALKAEPLFKSAHAALVFALNYSMQQYDRPLMNRKAAGPATGPGKGLSGVDGAGQAGMVRVELAKLTPIQQAALVASVAPQQLPCECKVSCCSGLKLNQEWANAIRDLTTAAAAGALSGCLSNGRLRSMLIQRLFGAKVTLSQLAEDHKVDERTVSAHHAKLKRWMFGGAGEVGLHQQASQAFTHRLRACGWLDVAEGE
ncbi:hypothetical protein ABFG95_11985 [Achromobacter sp. HNDS-1]|uniref:Uncharacterized protein n=1 Tax=Achromobacter sp. HNDS-1 TaxID=3151598 RepID=A0AAU7LGY4_9BURK